MLEDDAFPGQTVEVGRMRVLGAKKAHAVGAGRIDGDQHQVGFGGGCGERETKKDKTNASNYFSYHDYKCKGCAAIDQNRLPEGFGPSLVVLTLVELRV